MGIISAMGAGIEAHARTLFATQHGALTLTDEFSPGVAHALGVVDSPLADMCAFPVCRHSRNNQLLLHAWGQILPQWESLSRGVEPLRVAVVLGTSTSGIRESESAYVAGAAPDDSLQNLVYERQEIAAPAAFIADLAGAQGPIYTLSTACTSGAKALAAGRRLLQAGLADLVIAGGVDTLCRLTVNGFNALAAVSTQPCNPFSANRCGINIGEGAALFLLSRNPAALALVGAGESSDAHHISAPDPQGRGAEVAIRQALADAGLAPEQVGYVNLHGTATGLNDRMESHVISRVFGLQTPCSSTKPFTGHTLGAAGAIEAVLCAVAMQRGRLPVHLWDQVRDPGLADIHLVGADSAWLAPPEERYALSTSFAFGGNNIALLLAHGDGVSHND
jgi:3-oxoacyl-[acyl-carrier-protein] synthase-1